ncbi:MAG: Asp23/Gls24 family envelope stress response protein [Anaerolineae bacterium]|nr:MAG: Asp23/Gls24 family envelope stress response protein [Anaerolineae bacterium]
MTISESTRPPGKTTIAPDVLLDIARLTTLGITGVSQLATSQAMARLFQGGHQSSGVRVLIDDNRVDVDIRVILFPDHNLRQVSRDIQNSVARAINDMVGMEIGRVNIHIEDIDYGIQES